MSWDSVILDQCDSSDSLISAIDHLFACQRSDWETFRQGESTLSTIRRKTITDNDTTVVVQANPGRSRSTHAKTDAKSVAARKCFLCPENMPREERGIACNELVILPNPYPILGRHCTIPHRDHRPQRIEAHLGVMLELARKLGPEMVVFYNGPRCGASAPDHFHFQACDAEGIPLIGELAAIDLPQVPLAHESLGRRFLVLASPDPRVVQQRIERSVEVMRDLSGDDEEPMLNLIAQVREGGYQAILFPRAAHRPACYFAQGTRQLAISPAALEMAGVLVVAEQSQFERVDVEAACRIYTEVSLDSLNFSQLVDAYQ